MSHRTRPRALAVGASVLALALASGGCGRLGHDASAIFAAHQVLRRELPQFQIDFAESHIVSRERPYYMVELTARLTLDDGEGSGEGAVRSFLVVLALNPRNGVQFRWHPGTAVEVLPGPEPSPALVAEMKRRNRWGSAVDWTRRLHRARG